MNISALFIRRPIATSLLMLALLLSGMLAYRLLPVASLRFTKAMIAAISAVTPLKHASRNSA